MVISFRVRIIIRPFLEMAQPHMISHNIAVHHSQGVWTNSHAIVIAVISTVFIVFCCSIYGNQRHSRHCTFASIIRRTFPVKNKDFFCVLLTIENKVCSSKQPTGFLSGSFSIFCILCDRNAVFPKLKTRNINFEKNISCCICIRFGIKCYCFPA